jgi:hypothetical protein
MLGKICITPPTEGSRIYAGLHIWRLQTENSSFTHLRSCMILINIP